MTHKPSTSIFGLALIAPDKMGGEGGREGGRRGVVDSHHRYQCLNICG